MQDEWFWRIQKDGALSQRPHQIATLWNEVTWPIDAAVESDDKIYFFVGKYFYTFDGQRLIAKKPLTELGLPATVERIRLVYAWNYWTEKPVYIWTKKEFWRVDKVPSIINFSHSLILVTSECVEE
ncbi:unnamed protein product [Gongylonema pulchrum]|uniref:Hemopexin n=1 Tax=Gongylonema pulchrum TaxID=637853 RepID=A0A183DK38_9BILA|nr:unnamed protein product [Gongylonema pulchrum]